MRLSAIMCVLLAASSLAGSVYARKVRVRGGAGLFAHARVAGGGKQLELRGHLSDDDHTAIEGAWVELRASGFPRLNEALGCNTPRVSVKPHAAGLAVQTAAGGELCLRWEDPPARGRIDLRFPGDPYHGAASLTVDFDRAKPSTIPTKVALEPRPTIIDLDRRRVVLAAQLSLAEPSAHAGRGGLSLSLEDELGTRIAEAHTGGDGRARFDVDTHRHLVPGGGKLVVRFAGNAILGPARDEVVTTRRVTVRLAAGPITAVDPGDDATVALRVESARGPVKSGLVEAVRDGRGVSSAEVKDGAALLRVPVPPKETGASAVTIRYLSSSPWYHPGPSLPVVLPVAPPSPVLRVLLALLVVAGGAWVALGWRRSKTRPRREPGTLALAPGVHVVHSTRGAKSWRGTVLDAHDGLPLRGVEVVVRHPSLDGDGVLLRTETDAYGKFAFDLDVRPEGAELVAQSESHSPERRLLPAGGTLRVALVTRRRAALQRLVRWAQARGRPYDADPEPTPAHVRRVGAEREDVRRWAVEVETAAFGPATVDRDVEERLRDRTPD